MDLRKFVLELSVNDDQGKLRTSPALGALMHGLLMDVAGSDRLHSGTNGARPYSQYLSRISDETYLWIINVLDTYQCASILDWLEKGDSNLFLKHYQLELQIVSITEEYSGTYAEFMQGHLSEIPPKFLNLQFKTPTAFKLASSGNYCMWPEPRLIAQSALRRWNTFSQTASFQDPEILEDISQNVHVQSYNLRSRGIAMDGTHFSGSIGQIAFYLHRNTAVRQVFNLACAYSEFCGLGIKTAMGMGACGYSLRRFNKFSRNSLEQSDRRSPIHA
ncbi:MAG: CRISPR system precrRNA processing endoribonuclease RAMP protein Cas6 [Candidatus Obscuribacterales bacterium]|nr:CRISPR system precrRNA processing endoribonuclease RAMP protein Cas6 [Candidatus Obscuribacterales bacterium]